VTVAMLYSKNSLPYLHEVVLIIRGCVRNKGHSVSGNSVTW
jgi:hypothetical protein